MARIDDEMKTKFANDRHRLMANVVFTRNWIYKHFDEFIKPFEISSQQFNVLRILRGANDWLNMNEVKNRMIEKSPNTTRLCDKLVDKKFIERRRGNEDRRAVYLKISDDGMKLLQRIDDEDDGTIMSFINNVSDEEARIANDILDKLRV